MSHPQERRAGSCPRARAQFLAFATCLALLAADIAAQDATPAPEPRKAVQRGLDYLASHQDLDGSWNGKVGYKLNDDYLTSGRAEDHVGFTALAGLAMLASGSTPGQGPYGENLSRAVDHLLNVASQRQDGYITSGGTRMYEFAFCTRFLAEISSAHATEKVTAALGKAADLLIHSQNQEGGWRYQPFPRDADLSVTGCVLHALLSAVEAGVAVPKDVLGKAIEYVKRCGNRSQNGSFAYQDLPAEQTRSTLVLTWIGVSCLAHAGDKDAAALKRGLQFASLHQGELPPGSYHYFYGHYYGAQSYAYTTDASLDSYFARLRQEILATQKEDGHWVDDIDPVYATAMACLILQTQKRQ